MKRNFLSIKLLVLFFVLVQTQCYSQCKPDWLWWKTGLMSTTDFVSTGMAVDKSNNIYITGWWEGGGTIKLDSVTLNAKGYGTGMIAKYNSKGKLIWAKSLGNGGGDYSTGVVVDNSGNIYLTGKYTSDPITFDNFKLYSFGYKSWNVFLVKYNPDGKVLWAKRSGGTHPNGTMEVRGIAVDNNANITVTGMTTGMTFVVGNDTLHHNPITPGNYEFDVFIVKFDSSGNYVWGQIPKAPINGDEMVYALKADSKNNLYIAGNFSMTMDFDSIRLSNINCMYVAKYSPSGKVIWARTMKISPKPSLSGSRILPNDIVCDSQQNIYIGGLVNFDRYDTVYFDSYYMTLWSDYANNQGFVVKMDSNGKVKWLSVTKGLLGNEINHLGLDAKNNVYATGQTECDSMYFDGKWYKSIYGNNGSAPGFVIKYNPEGKFRWMKPIINDYGTYSPRGGCHLDANGNLYSFGFFTGKIVFGNDTINGDGTFNSVLFKMSTDPDAAITKRDILCNGNSDGWIKIQPLGGTPPYRYNWNGGQKTAYISNLSTGQYIYSITDTNNCNYNDTVILSEPSPLSTAVSVKDDKDNKNIGEATATASGGTPPYKYQWNDPANQKTAKATGLGAGSYKVVITDFNGCTKDTSITVKNTVSIEESNIYVLNVYPNPVEKKVFYVELLNTHSKPVTIILYDTGGNKVTEKKINPATGIIKEQLRIENARAGIYHLNVIIGSSIFTRDIIVH